MTTGLIGLILTPEGQSVQLLRSLQEEEEEGKDDNSDEEDEYDYNLLVTRIGKGRYNYKYKDLTWYICTSMYIYRKQPHRNMIYL